MPWASLIISTVRSYTADLTHFLFGNLLGVSNSDLWLIFGFGLVVVAVMTAFYKEFVVISFDPILAKTLRLPIGFLNALLLLLVAVTIVSGAASGRHRPDVGHAGYAGSHGAAANPPLAAGDGPVGFCWEFLSGVVGLYLSFYLNVASGPAIVLVCTAFFLAALFFSPRQGFIKRLITARQAVDAGEQVEPVTTS